MKDCPHCFNQRFLVDPYGYDFPCMACLYDFMPPDRAARAMREAIKAARKKAQEIRDQGRKK